MDVIAASFEKFVENSPIFPSAAILYMNRSDEFFGSMNHQKAIKKSVKRINKALPSSCPLIGCLGAGVIGCNNYQALEIEQSESASLLVLPPTKNVHFSQFFVTITDMQKAGKDVKKWTKLFGFPRDEKIKVVLLHACCEDDFIEKAIGMILQVCEITQDELFNC